MKRILVAGTNSGCGKTTLVCAILSALKNRGVVLRAFKCGPDFIDPMFHRSVLDVPAWNLDPYFLDPPGLRAHLSVHASRDTLAVIEGVMGYYDGIAMTDEASTFSAASATETPVVLAVDVAGTGNSIAALIEGFTRHREPSGIRGVIFNGCSSGMYPRYRELAEKSGVKALGYMPRNKEWSIEGRGLGLIPPAEIAGLRQKLAALGKQAEESIDLAGLLELASSAPELPDARTDAGALVAIRPEDAPGSVRRNTPRSAPRLAVARDGAFCFIYEENLEILKRLGCEPVFFSPLNDTALPEKISGLYLPGGYQDLFISKLSANTAMLRGVREAARGGLPTIAEGGGFLYLHETMDGVPMSGVISAAAFRTEKLKRFGYVEITAKKDNLLCSAGDAIRAHEFHYWESSSPGDDFSARKANGAAGYTCAYATPTLYAGFPYLYFPANPAFAKSFVETMKKYHDI